ncbi:MAG TPA: hypothetical protein VLB84_10210, partial [Bacteroidia bacterium]|nr:hypothetical protein [Bacteroidia bacterium]
GCSSAGSIPVNITTYTLPEDFNNDGMVSGADLNALLVKFGMECICPMDLNHDGQITVQDLNKLLVVFGSNCSGIVPPSMPQE